MTRAAAHLQRSGHPARRRPGRDPVRADRGRGALPRRDPPAVPAGRGDALPGDGGLPGRRRRRQGPGRDGDPDRDPALHPGRRDHPRRAAAGPAARPLRLHRPARLLRRRPTSSTSSGARPCCSASTSTPTPRREIAGRSRGTPRIANRLLRRVRDFAEVRGSGRLTQAVAAAALELYEVDSIGLDRLDRAVLVAICRRFAGGPVGLSTLAISVGEERETVEEVAEPFLVREGFLMRTPRGRVATPAAWAHLGLHASARRRRRSRRAARPTPTCSRDGGFSAVSLGRVHRSGSGLRSVRHPPTPTRNGTPWLHNQYSTLILVLLMVVAFYFLILRPQKKRQQAAAEDDARARARRPVLLGSGLFGTLVSVGDQAGRPGDRPRRRADGPQAGHRPPGDRRPTRTRSTEDEVGDELEAEADRHLRHRRRAARSCAPRPTRRARRARSHRQRPQQPALTARRRRRRRARGRRGSSRTR